MSAYDPEAIVEIQQKIYRYGWCIDHRLYDELDSIFAPDAVVHYDVSGGTMKPWPEMKGWLRERFPVFRVTQYNMSNPVIDLDGQTATSATYGHLVHVQHLKDETTSVFRHYAIYRDDWQRTADGWRIQLRRLSNLYMEGPVYGPDRVYTYDELTPF